CGFGFVSFTVPTVTEVLTACGGGAVTGTRTPGQTCASAADCTAEANCQSDTRSCPGTCVPWLDAGTACTVGSGAWCNWHEGYNCNGGICRKPLDDGAPCVQADSCKSGTCKADAGRCV